MKSLARFLIRLYPATWRERYGEEFETLLEDSASGWPAIFDLLKEAIRMQLSAPAFPKLALMLSAAGLAVGLAISFMVTPRYISEAGMAFEGDAAGTNFLEFLTQCEKEVLSRASLSGIIQDPRLNLYPEERAGTPLEDVIETMRRRNIMIRLNGRGPGRLAFRIDFSYRDPVKAQHTVQALLVRFMEANLHLPAPVNLSVVASPSLPAKAVFPDRWIFMGIGFGAGFFAALVIAIFRHRPPPIPFPAQTA
jgi:hypothetical protein